MVLSGGGGFDVGALLVGLPAVQNPRDRSVLG